MNRLGQIHDNDSKLDTVIHLMMLSAIFNNDAKRVREVELSQRIRQSERDNHARV